MFPSGGLPQVTLRRTDDSSTIYLAIAIGVSFCVRSQRFPNNSTSRPHISKKATVLHTLRGMKEDIDKPLSAILTPTPCPLWRSGGAQAQNIWNEESLTVSVVVTIPISS